MHKLLTDFIFWWNKPSFPVHKQAGGFQAWKNRKKPSQPSWRPIFFISLFLICGCTGICTATTGFAAYAAGRAANRVKPTTTVESTAEAESTAETTPETTPEVESTVEATPEVTAAVEVTPEPESTTEATAVRAVRYVVPTPTLLPETTQAGPTLALPTETPFPTYIGRDTDQPEQRVIVVRETVAPRVIQVTEVVVIVQTAVPPAPVIVTATPNATLTPTLTATATATMTETTTATASETPTTTMTETPTASATLTETPTETLLPTETETPTEATP